LQAGSARIKKINVGAEEQLAIGNWQLAISLWQLAFGN
jgi:hypothetical protein